jgi:hypothetical protein
VGVGVGVGHDAAPQPHDVVNPMDGEWKLAVVPPRDVLQSALRSSPIDLLIRATRSGPAGDDF